MENSSAGSPGASEILSSLVVKFLHGACVPALDREMRQMVPTRLPLVGPCCQGETKQTKKRERQSFPAVVVPTLKNVHPFPSTVF